MMHVISLIQSANLGELQPYIGILIKGACEYGPNHFKQIHFSLTAVYTYSYGYTHRIRGAHHFLQS